MGHEKTAGIEKYPRKQKKNRDVLLLGGSCSFSSLCLFYAVLQGSAALLKLSPADTDWVVKALCSFLTGLQVMFNKIYIVQNMMFCKGRR